MEGQPNHADHQTPLEAKDQTRQENGKHQAEEGQNHQEEHDWPQVLHQPQDQRWTHSGNTPPHVEEVPQRNQEHVQTSGKRRTCSTRQKQSYKSA